MSTLNQYIADGLKAGCPLDQMQNFGRFGIVLQDRQLAASAAARLCDAPDGPTAIGYGGARGGGKSHWLLAQMGADDCQRLPGLKCLLLRKSNKANIENFNDLRQRLFPRLKGGFSATTGTLTFPNGSRIIAKHYQTEKEISESFLGLEYDVIGIEEATTLTAQKYKDILTCLRTSKPNWRPRLYSTTNPGGVGHEWYRTTFVVPYDRHTESATRFIPSRITDNAFLDPEAKNVLARTTGWQNRAWFEGRWDIAAGQFFNTFRRDLHVLDHFDDWRGVEWMAAMDYGYTHYTVVLLGCLDQEDNLYIVDEHAERGWIPQRHSAAIREMFARHKIFLPRKNEPQFNPHGTAEERIPICWPPGYQRPNAHLKLARFVAGADLFSTQYDGSTLARQFSDLGVYIRPANTNRVQGWIEIQKRLGDADAGIKPTMFIHKRCARLLDCLPYLQHDPDHPADVLKTHINEEGEGGDDAADALRYLLATPARKLLVRRLRGL